MLFADDCVFMVFSGFRRRYLKLFHPCKVIFVACVILIDQNAYSLQNTTPKLNSQLTSASEVAQGCLNGTSALDIAGKLNFTDVKFDISIQVENMIASYNWTDISITINDKLK